MNTLGVLLLTIALSSPATRPADPHAAAEAAAADPPATGLLVTAVIQRRQGHDRGVRPGEVITRYGPTPTPTIRSIAAAISEAADAGEQVPVTLVSRDGERVLAFDPGPLGLVVHEVAEGKADEMRPPATDAALDLSPLRGGPVEAWYRVEAGVGSVMHAPGEHIGFQHWRVRRVGGGVIVEAEVAWGGPLGDKHFLLRAVFDGDPLSNREVRCAWPDHGRVYRLVRVEPGRMRFTLTGVEPGEDGPVVVPGRAAEPIAFLQLARFMPTDPGASVHFTPLDIEQGTPLGPTAMHVVGPWFGWHGGEMLETTRVDLTGSGTREQSAFVDGNGRLVMIDQGDGQLSRLTTRAGAVAGLPEGMTPLGFDAEVGPGTDAGRPQGDIEAVALDPPATGVLVTSVMPESAAAAAGLQPGAVIVKCAGNAVTDLDGLVAAVEAAEGGRRTTRLTYVDGGGEHTVDVAAGRLGLTGLGVERGKPLRLRPPATGVTFDFSDLVDRPREQWLAFTVDGEHVGFEHHVMRREGDTLVLDSEVAFTHEQWGRQHFVVRTEAAADADATLERSRYAFVPTGFRGDLRVERTGDGAATLHAEQCAGDDRVTSERPVSGGAQSDYLATQLASWMPREVGACWHYDMVNIADGTPQGLSALRVKGREAIEIDGREVDAWRIEQHRMGAPGRVTWVDAEGRVLRHDYGGGAAAVRSTREAALAGLPAAVRPVGQAATRPTIGGDE